MDVHDSLIKHLLALLNPPFQVQVRTYGLYYYLRHPMEGRECPVCGCVCRQIQMKTDWQHWLTDWLNTGGAVSSTCFSWLHDSSIKSVLHAALAVVVVVAVALLYGGGRRRDLTWRGGWINWCVLTGWDIKWFKSHHPTMNETNERTTHPASHSATNDWTT